MSESSLKQKQKIKAILVDIDNTMIPTGNFAITARNNAIDALLLGGINFERNVVTRRLNKIIKKYGSNYPSHFDVLLDEMGLPSRTKNKLVAIATIAYHDTKQTLHPFPDVPRTLKELNKQGYKLYAVSEGLSKKQWEKIYRTNIDVVLDDAFMTEDFGFEFKNSQFFKVVLSEIKQKPELCVMIGDRLDKDIGPAKENRIHTVKILTGRHKNEETLATEIKADYEIKKFNEIMRILPLIEEKLNH